MSTVDLLIIYLAFGSPLMVHRYLFSSHLSQPRRVLVSLFTLAFWIPVATQMVYRRLVNAYSRASFVTVEDLDSIDRLVADLRKTLKAELPNAGRSFAMRDVVVTVERYVALSIAWRERGACAFQGQELFSVAGTDPDLASVCLTRRNRRRIETQHMRARADLLSVFAALSETPAARAAMEDVLTNIAPLLDDRELFNSIEQRRAGSGRLWTIEEAPAPAIMPPGLAPIAMISPPNGD